jgi:hypothetical protein
MTDPLIDETTITQFNRDLADRGCTAHVELFGLEDAMVACEGRCLQILVLIDDEGRFITELPLAVSCEMVALAYALHGRGVTFGVQAGEDAAWAKLRFLIGAAAA